MGTMDVASEWGAIVSPVASSFPESEWTRGILIVLDWLVKRGVRIDRMK